jgi:Leucine-rich repeat (LRR) protein
LKSDQKKNVVNFPCHFALLLLPTQLGRQIVGCQVTGDTCTFTSKFLENNERAIIVADHTEPGSSNADIKRVIFVSSSIYQVPAELFVTFLNLEILVMEGQHVQEIKANTFINAKKLKHLNLNSNNIQKIEELTFEGAVDLQLISLVSNKIQSVHKDAFKSLKYITYFGFWNNLIQELHPETFYHNQNLVALSLGRNNLQYLHKEIVSKNTNLKTVHFSYNQLNALSNTMFSHLKSLDVFHLESNNCVNIFYENDAASHMAEIEASLRNCTISYLSLENDQLKDELKEIKVKLDEGLGKILKALHVQ